jgi:glycosyltransferase involved in cell wall biosynthesis
VIEWRVLGPGDAAKWQELAEKHGVGDQVHFDGVRPAGAAVLAWLDDIDVHCQPSYQEGLPRATIEAMSRGCACLGSTAGGIPELLPPDRLHAPGDTAALARLIGGMASDHALIAAASQQDRAASVRYEAASIDGVRAAVFARFAEAAGSSHNN